jgi:maltooligosyltrehalose trehalohydrolase
MCAATQVGSLCQMLNPNFAAQLEYQPPHGPRLLGDGSWQLRLWAPAHPGMRLEVAGHPALYGMVPASNGWHQVSLRKLEAGARYAFVLPDGTRVPDPASHYQPDAIGGMSALIDPDSYQWRDEGWTGRPWHTAVLYELHLGTFTPEGTFRAAAAKLDHLVSLGVTALELMPIAAFPGRRNWGYDGVFPYACAKAYGRPDDLKYLIDEAHTRGLMVLLDVVYNHFGPEGNYLSLYAPQFFTERHHTPWGAAVNFDGAESAPVREFFIGNALRWLQEFHVDGLRLDAVHAIVDDSARHFLDELADRVHEYVPDRAVHLILENEENQAARLLRDNADRPLTFTAQWNDDVHHVLHSAATGEARGYYADYYGDTAKLGRALAEGFAFQGEVMPFRGSPRGEASGFLPPEAFIAFIQNHDQIGNHAYGERWGQLAPQATRRAVAAVYLLLPQIPLLFMGEEWNAAQPFPFFCDFGGELGQAVRKGRQAEFAHLPEFSDPARRHTIPDPVDEATFKAAVLCWDDLQKAAHTQWLAWYRQILKVRHADIVPRLTGLSSGGTFCVRGPRAVTVRWRCGRDEFLQLYANLSDSACSGFPILQGREIWLEGQRRAGILQPWSVQWEVLEA